jgi:hypothetical protein
MQGFSGRIFTPRGLGNLEIGKPAPNFLKNLSKTGGLSLQDAACANFAKEKSEA